MPVGLGHKASPSPTHQVAQFLLLQLPLLLLPSLGYHPLVIHGIDFLEDFEFFPIHAVQVLDVVQGLRLRVFLLLLLLTFS